MQIATTQHRNIIFRARKVLEENCNLAEDRVGCLEGELRDVTVIADESAMKFDEVANIPRPLLLGLYFKTYLQRPS